MLLRAVGTNNTCMPRLTPHYGGHVIAREANYGKVLVKVYMKLYITSSGAHDTAKVSCACT